MARYFTYFLLLLLVESCQFIPQRWILQSMKNEEKLKKEIIKEYYPSGKIKSINESVNNKRHGVCKYYSEDGKLTAIAHFKMNKYQGEQVSYYPNGNVRGKVNYVDHQKHGASLGYYEDGTLYIKENYLYGRLNGQKQKFYKNGQLMMENFYRDGRPSIQLHEYDKMGKVITNYPELIIEVKNMVAFNNTYLLKIFFSNKPRSGKYYIDELEAGVFLPRYITPLDKEDGIATYSIEVPPEGALLQKVNIIASMKTRLGHTKVVSKSYNIGSKH